MGSDPSNPLVVSDASTLIHLAKIGHLHLLETFFGAVTIPPAVWCEVVEQGAGKEGSLEVKQADWIKVDKPTDVALVRLLIERARRWGVRGDCVGD